VRIFISRSGYFFICSSANIAALLTFKRRSAPRVSMASSKAHHATGFAAGVIAAAVVARVSGNHAFHLDVLLSFLAGIWGSTAPDWLEVAWWSRTRRLWITHRTLTHWGVGWLALLAASFHWLGHSLYAAPAFGFACGGLMHLFADWPNPLGVPWIAVAASWVAAWFIGEHVWLHGMHEMPLLQHLRAG
jgi:hypothetical protein